MSVTRTDQRRNCHAIKSPSREATKFLGILIAADHRYAVVMMHTSKTCERESVADTELENPLDEREAARRPRGESKPGEGRGGRQKGTPNKRTQDVAQLLAQMGCDPIEGMARIAMNEKLSPELRGRMYAELARYVYPKLKAIGHTGPGGGPMEIVEILQRRRNALAAEAKESGFRAAVGDAEKC